MRRLLALAALVSCGGAPIGTGPPAVVELSPLNADPIVRQVLGDDGKEWTRDDLLHRSQRVTTTTVRGGRCPQWHDTAIAAGWPESEWPTIDRVMYAESRCNPNAYNPHNNAGYGHARGLMQVMDELWAPECGITFNQLYDPYLNMVCALHVWNEQGWEAWVTY